MRGVKPTCRVLVAVVPEPPGAGSEVFLLRWRQQPGAGAEPSLSAGAPVPSLSLEAQPASSVLRGMTPAPSRHWMGQAGSRASSPSAQPWPRAAFSNHRTFCPTSPWACVCCVPSPPTPPSCAPRSWPTCPPHPLATLGSPWGPPLSLPLTLPSGSLLLQLSSPSRSDMPLPPSQHVHICPSMCSCAYTCVLLCACTCICVCVCVSHSGG